MRVNALPMGCGNPAGVYYEERTALRDATVPHPCSLGWTRRTSHPTDGYRDHREEHAPYPSTLGMPGKPPALKENCDPANRQGRHPNANRHWVEENDF